MEENSESEKKERENNEIKQANIINSQISEASDPKKKKKKNKKKKDKNQNEKEEEKTAENNNEPTQDPKAQFEKELEWCINQIRMGMQINKLDQQQR